MSKYLMLFMMLLAFNSLVSAQTFDFVTCGQEGRSGPSQSDCDPYYSGENNVNVVGDGIQEWEAPHSGIYRVTAYGPSGLNQNPSEAGDGAVMQGEFDLNEGETLQMMVGQQSSYSGSRDWFGGSGGTYIVDSTDTPLLVAGGGAGHRTDSYTTQMRANTGTRGKDGENGNRGVDGSGGTNPDPYEYDGNYQGGGGAGWEDGGSPSPDDRYDQTINSETFLDGGVGGYHVGDDNILNDGGFGGGGAGGWGDAGGAGGYSGGGPNALGPSYGWGGGGGSFIHGSADDAATSDGSFGTTGSEPHSTYSGTVNDLNQWNTGDGRVEIELLTNPDNPNIISDNFDSISSDPARIEGDLDVDIDYDGGRASNNELESCEVEASGVNSGGTVNVGTSISGDSCSFSVNNEDHGNWDPDEEIRFDIVVRDSYGGEDSLVRYEQFKGGPNPPQLQSPANGADNVGVNSDLEARFTHPGGNSVNARFYLDDGSGYSQVGSTQTATDGETVSVSPNLDDGSNYNWYAEAESQGVTKTSSTWSFTTNFNPDIESTNADQDDESHSIFFTSDISDGDGRSDIDECTLTVSDSDGDSETYDITPEPGGTSNKANCNQNVSYSDNSGWSHTETLDFELDVQDQNGLSDMETLTETLPNHKPEIADLDFSSYADIRAFNVTLDVTDSDNGQEEIDICEFTFSDTEGTSITVNDEIDVDNGYGVTDLTRCRYSNVNASMPYPSTLEDGFEPGEEIEVDAEAYDLHGESATETDNWTIPLVDEGNFLTETSLDFDYSSVQMTESETEILDYQISNTNRFSQNVRVYLEGMNATFENNETSQSLMVAPFSNRNIEVIVSPQNTGKGILNFTVEHTNLGYNQTVKTPVNIRSSPRTLSTREVPGIGFFQLIMLVLLASYLYSVRP